MSELTILQTVRLKGRVLPADLATIINADTTTATSTATELAKAGFLVDGDTLRLTTAGRRHLELLLGQERSSIDVAAMEATYNDFRAVNTEFKMLVTDWQLKNGEVNTHEDAGYDAAVLDRLDGVHRQVLQIIAAAAEQVPRLGGYSGKLAAALDRIKAGETTWLTRPIIDSYHTVWFELHEELILAAGLTREDEANAGHAQ